MEGSILDKQLIFFPINHGNNKKNREESNRALVVADMREGRMSLKYYNSSVASDRRNVKQIGKECLKV